MLEKNFYVTIETGFARYAARLVSIAGNFSSSINILYKGQSVDLKKAPECIMQVMNLGINKHSSFTVKVHGTDEAQAIDEITDHLMSLNTMHAIVNKR